MAKYFEIFALGLDAVGEFKLRGCDFARQFGKIPKGGVLVHSIQINIF